MIRYKKWLALFSVLTGIGFYGAYAQSVGINTNTIDPSAVFQIESDGGKGFLGPRLTAAQRDAIVSPATGLLVFVTGVNKFFYFDGSSWLPFIDEGDNLGDHLVRNNINLNSYFLSGDGDNEGIFVDENGQVGINTNNPTELLDLHDSDGPTIKLLDSDAAANSGYISFGGSSPATGGNLNIGVNGAGPGYGAINFTNQNNIHFKGAGDIILEKTGNVGIGTTGSITEKLEVNGNVKRLIGDYTSRTVELPHINLQSNFVLLFEKPTLSSGEAGAVIEGTFTLHRGQAGSSNEDRYGRFIASRGHNSNYNANIVWQAGDSWPATFSEVDYNGKTYLALKFESNTRSTGIILDVKYKEPQGVGTVFDNNFLTTQSESNITNEVPNVGVIGISQTIHGTYKGNLGIGTTNPTEKLEVNGAIKMTDGNQAAGKVMVSDANGVASWQTIPQSISLVDADNDTKIQVEESADEDRIRFDVAGNEAMHLTNNGFLGIGTSTPNSKLHVGNGNIQIDNSRNIYGTRVDGSPVGLLTFDAANKTQIGSNSTASAITIFNDKVGVGTLNPSTKFQVQNGATAVRINPTATNGYNFDINVANTGVGFAHNSATDKHFTFNGNGNVGIGTTVPSATLDMRSRGNDISTNYFQAFNSNNQLLLRAADNGDFKSFGGIGADGHLYSTDGNNAYWALRTYRANLPGNNSEELKVEIPLGLENDGSIKVKLIEANNGKGSYYEKRFEFRYSNCCGSNSIFSSNTETPIRLSGGPGYIISDGELNGNILTFYITSRNTGGIINAGGSITFELHSGRSSSNLAKDVLDGVVLTKQAASYVSPYDNFYGQESLIVPSFASHSDANAALPQNAKYFIDNDPSMYISRTGVITNPNAANNEPWRNLDGSAATDASTDINYGGGSVGIGTTTPTEKLEVNGAIKMTDGNQAAGKVMVSDANGVASWQTIPQSNGLADADNDTKIQVEESADEDKIRFDVAGNEALVIDNNGKIGVGLASPAAALDVIGTDMFVSSNNNNSTLKSGVWGTRHFLSGEESLTGMQLISGSGNNFLNLGGGAGGYNAVTNIGFYTASSNNTLVGTERMRITNNGNVGIGTANPNAKLEVAGWGAHEVLVGNQEENASIKLSRTGAAASSITISSNSARPSIDVEGDYLPFIMDGNERLRLIASGNLGIGLTNPSEKLAVNGSIIIPSDGIAQGSSAGSLIFEGEGNASNTQRAAFKLDAHGGLNGERLDLFIGDGSIRFGAGLVQARNFYYNNASTNLPMLINWNNVSKGLELTNGYVQTSGRFLNLINGGSSLMVVDHEGKVGIGTTTPTEKLEVNGAIKMTDGNQAVGKVMVSDVNGVASWQTIPQSNSLVDTDGDTKIQVEESADEDKIRFDVTGNEAMIIDDAGRVGVGTSSPVADFEIKNTTNGISNLNVEYTGGKWVELIAGANGTGAVFDNSSFFSLFKSATHNNSSPTELMRLTNAGLMGLGTSNPQAKLEVYDNASSYMRFNPSGTFSSAQISSQSVKAYIIANPQSSGSQQIDGIGMPYGFNLLTTSDGVNTNLGSLKSSAGGGINYYSSLNGSNHSHRFYHNGAEQMRLQFDGNLGVGTTNPTEKLEVNGKVKVGPNATWSQSLMLGIDNALTSVNLATVGATNGNLHIEAKDNNDVYIQHYNTTGDVILSTDVSGKVTTGKVGIGTENPTEKLEVNGSIKMTDGNQAAGKVMVSDANGVGSWSNPVTPNLNHVTSSSNYTLQNDINVVLLNATSNVITVTLPAAASHNGRVVQIKKIDTSSNAITIDASGSETIDGAITQSTNIAYSGYVIMSDGTNWHIIGRI